MKNFDRLILEKTIHWPLFFYDGMFDVDKASTKEKDVIDFIVNKLSFGYCGAYKNAFEPLANLFGKRTCVFEDLVDEDFITLNSLIGYTSNSFLLGKFNDVLFIKTGDAKYGVEAFNNYKKCAESFIKVGKSCLATNFIQRALFILHSLDDDEMISTFISEFLNRDRYKDTHNFIVVINSLFSFLKEFNYKKLNKNQLINIVQENLDDESDETLFCIKNIIDFYTSVGNKIKANLFINKYADLCETLCKKRSPGGYYYIDKAIKVLSKYNDENAARINDLEFVLEEEHRKMFNSMNFQEIPIEGEVNNLINEHIQKAQKKLMNEKDSIKQFTLFFRLFIPVTDKELTSFSNEMDKSVFTSLSREIIFDKDKKIIDEIGPDDKTKRKEQNYIQAYQLFHSIYFAIAAKYISCIVIDDELLLLLKDILSHNEFVPKERIDIVYNNVVGGLKNDVRQCVFNLIAQFEKGCFEFLRRKQIYPTILSGSKRKNADLNHFLTIKKFRDHFMSILGADLTKELQHLLIDKRYGNLRNHVYHTGTDDSGSYTSIELLSFFKILNAYCMGYDHSIN